jgi:hypothetical protein
MHRTLRPPVIQCIIHYCRDALRSVIERLRLRCWRRRLLRRLDRRRRE